MGSCRNASATALLALALYGCQYDDLLNRPEDAGIEVPTTPPSEAELLSQRSFAVIEPSGYDASVPWPMVVIFHGYGGNTTEMMTYFRLNAGTARRALVVAPRAAQNQLGIASWDAKENRWPNWDASFVAAVIHEVKRTHNVDASRVVAFGFSQGGHMAHRTACDVSSDVTAVISIAGQMNTGPSDCVPKEKVTALQIHGTADAVVGYNARPSAHDTIGVWARTNGCTGSLQTLAFSPVDLSGEIDGDETIVEGYDGCPENVSVTLWSMQEVGHRPSPQSDFSSRLLNFAFGRPRR